MHQRNKIHPVGCDLKSINPTRLQKCLDEPLSALAEVAKARGMAQVAAAAGLGRESLCKALAPGSHPRFETINAVLRALNVKISVVLANSEGA